MRNIKHCIDVTHEKGRHRKNRGDRNMSGTTLINTAELARAELDALEEFARAVGQAVRDEAWLDDFSNVVTEAYQELEAERDDNNPDRDVPGFHGNTV